MLGFQDTRSTLIVCGECGQNTRVSDRTGRAYFHRDGAEECPGSGAQIFSPAPEPPSGAPAAHHRRGSSHYVTNGFPGRGRGR